MKNYFAIRFSGPCLLSGYQNFAFMYFRLSVRYYKAKRQLDACCRLVESFRNADGRVLHLTILNIGFIDDDYNAGQLNQTARILTAGYEQKQPLFRSTDLEVIELVETLSQRGIADKRLGLTLHRPISRHIDANTSRYINVHKIGAEWICHQTLEEPGQQHSAGRDRFYRRTNTTGYPADNKPCRF